MGILYAPLAFTRRQRLPGGPLSLRERAREGDRTGVICASRDCKFGINISRARPTVVEIDPGDSLPDRGENESGIVATVNGLAGFLSNGEAGQQDTQRVMEAILPVASLYGVDIGNVETRWFRHDKTY